MRQAIAAPRGRPTVLVVGPDARARARVRALLDPPYGVLDADGARDALLTLGQAAVDAVVVDGASLGTEAIDACRRVKARAGGYLPVLVVGARGGIRARHLSLEAGADDLVARGAERRELALRVDAFVRVREREQALTREVEELRRHRALEEELGSLVLHDLRNPLAGLFGLLHVVRAGAADPPLRGDVEAAIDAAQRVRDILDDLVTVRRLEEGRGGPAPSRSDLGEVVLMAVDAVGSVARERGVEVRTRVDGRVRVSVDPALLRRAVENLVANAVRYTRADRGVDVVAGRTAGGASVEVADGGADVPEAAKASLFDRFGGVGAAGAVGRRGVGLGLYLARLVAESHGGRMAVEDREGGGTVLRLLLPAVSR